MQPNRNRNIFDKIGKIIPGYRGYADRDERRNIDKKLRDEIAETLLSSQKSLQKHLIDRIAENDMIEAKRTESLIKELDTVSAKIKNSNYGSSSFFSENQVKAEQLDHIYNLDLILAERVNIIRTDAGNLDGEPLRINSIKKCLDEIDEKMLERNTYLKQFK